jgi:hypothetical protein
MGDRLQGWISALPWRRIVPSTPLWVLNTDITFPEGNISLSAFILVHLILAHRGVLFYSSEYFPFTCTSYLLPFQLGDSSSLVKYRFLKHCHDTLPFSSVLVLDPAVLPTWWSLILATRSLTLWSSTCSRHFRPLSSARIWLYSTFHVVWSSTIPWGSFDSSSIATVRSHNDSAEFELPFLVTLHIQMPSSLLV